MGRLATLALACAYCHVLAPTTLHAQGTRTTGVHDVLGIHCANAGDAKKAAANKSILTLAADLGLGWARCSGGPAQWWGDGAPQPDNFAEVIGFAEARGIRVFLQLEYRRDIDGGRLGDYDWYATGRSFARAFGATVGAYGILNEVDHSRSVEDYGEVAAALRRFADGVHSVDPSLLVSTPGLGGTPMSVGNTDALLRALAPLLNDGTVQVLNLHSYQDIKRGQRSNILETAEWSPSRNFARAKAAGGITANVLRGAGEYNYRSWPGRDDYPSTPDERGSGFFTTVWDQLTAVGSGGVDDNRNLFAVAYAITSDEDGADGKRYRAFHMAHAWESLPGGGYVYEPSAKGTALVNTLAATRGMRFQHLDPLGKGIAVLRGGGKKMWMWHNRAFFSDLDDPAVVTVSGIPPRARTLRILRWDSTLDDPLHTIRLGEGETSRALDCARYLPHGETYLIVADDAGDADVVGGITAGAPDGTDGSAVDVRINFQPRDAPAPEGWATDHGLTHRPQGGLTYGWSADHTDHARLRPGATGDALTRSLVIVKRYADWQLDLPAGTYDVTVALGDPLYATSPVNLTAEGVPLLLDASLPAGRPHVVEEAIYVGDGALTLDFGTGPGAAARVNYVAVTESSAAARTPTPATTFAPDGAEALALAPNPAGEYAELRVAGGGVDELASVAIVTLAGRIAREVPLGGTAGALRLDLAGLAPGLYAVRATWGAGGVQVVPLAVGR